MDFINTFGKLVSRMSIYSAYFPSVLIAQGILETDHGRSMLSTLHNNYFGIKAGSQWQGQTVNMNTGEVFGGQAVTVAADFRKYNSVEDSISDRINWMKKMPIYNLVGEARTPETQAQEIQNAGYATDPNYSNKLISLIEKYDLKQFDKNRNSMKNLNLAIAILLMASAALSIYKTVKY